MSPTCDSEVLPSDRQRSDWKENQRKVGNGIENMLGSVLLNYENGARNQLKT